MTNEQIAAVFDQIAELLALEDENVFRIRSYQRAAEVIRGLGRELAEIRAAGELEQLPGVGEAIAAKVEELLDTGDLQYLRKLQSRYPEGFLELLQVPGVGPKHAKLFLRELGVRNVADLRAAAEAGRIRQLPGMGARSEAKLLEALQTWNESQTRALLAEMLPLAEQMVQLLRGLPEVERADYAGSIRRGRETIGDLDLLATSQHPERVTTAFARSGALERVELAGDTKVSGLLPGGRQADLRVVEPDSYGAALVYFTGSQQHSIRLRERGQDLGLKVNEYGVFAEQDGVEGPRLAGATEEEVYAALGLPWIPPELREDRGELQAAEAGRLPQLITLHDIRCDLHLHSSYTDGADSIAALAEAARQRGYTHIGIADHSASLTVAGGIGEEQIAAQRAEVDRLNAQLRARNQRMRVLLGTEAEIRADGTVDLTPRIFELVDFVVGAVHQGFSADPDRMTARIIAALRTGMVDILAHPTGRLLLQRPAYAVHAAELVAAAVELGVALEINSSPDRLDLSDVNARLAVEQGALLTINSDAHNAANMDLIRLGVLTARRGWVEAPSVINTWPLRKLTAWLQARRQKKAKS